MNLKQAKEILKGAEFDDDYMHLSDGKWTSGYTDTMTLDGEYNLKELEAIVYWMKHPEEFK
jgi:hypothetical protein